MAVEEIEEALSVCPARRRNCFHWALRRRIISCNRRTFVGGAGPLRAREKGPSLAHASMRHHTKCTVGRGTVGATGRPRKADKRF